MDIIFKDKKIETYCRDQKKCTKKYGVNIFNSLNKLLLLLYNSDNLEEFNLSFNHYNVHPLLGKDYGQWAININQQYRLIFYPCDHDLQPQDIRQVRDMNIIEIQEISKHYE